MKKRWGVVPMGLAVAAASACHPSDGVGPRAPAVAWSQSSERQAEAIQAVLDGRKTLPSPPVVFVDGQRYDDRAPDGRFSVIDPDRIASIQAFTGADATARAGAAGRNGVIWITTKEAAAKH